MKMSKINPRPDPRGETCPHCQHVDTLRTFDSWTTYMADGTYRCVDEIMCYRCGLRFFVGWVAHESVNGKQRKTAEGG